MDWPLKIQGRFVTKAEIDEIRMLLQNHPLWNRTRLSRELCMRWNWQRPDGQIKDMACRELLRKLESRTLIKLHPRQGPGPGRLPIMVETFVDTTRYIGTCYKAANWLKIGQTKGRSRQDRYSKLKVSVKDILAYPLRRDFRKLLLA